MERFVIDVGSWTTKIYMLGCGVVLSEATCVAVQGSEGGEVAIKAFGDDARALSGRAAYNTRIINPVCEGEIVQPKLLSALLSHFLEKVEVTRRKAKNCEVMFVVPCSASDKLLNFYRRIAAELNIGRIYFTRTPYAAFLGQGIVLTPSHPVFCVDVGYGKTEIAVFSLDGMISGFSINLGGGNIDVHIMDLLYEDFSIKIGALTAEKLKNVVGSLLKDDNKMTVVDGRDAVSGAPSSVAINSSHLEEVIKLYVDKIIEYTRSVLSELPAEVSSEVMHGGIYLTGGLTRLDGFAEYFAEHLGISVNQSDEPVFATVLGGCTILSSPQLCSVLATLG